MNFNPFILISFLISTFFAFLITAFVVEIIIFFSPKKIFRYRTLLRYFPFFALGFDILQNPYSIGNWFNPLYCTSCVQRFIMELFFPDLKIFLQSNEIRFVHYLYNEDSVLFYTIGFTGFFLLTLFFAARKFYQVWITNHSLKSIVKNSTISIRSIKNALLADALLYRKQQVFVSEEIQIPIATHLNSIIIPKEIENNFPQDEFEAIIAHEAEHLRWKDPLLRTLMDMCASLLWWIPMKGWIKKIIQEQELASDQGVLTFVINGESLASALMRVSNQIKAKNNEGYCYLVNKKSPILSRIRIILGVDICEKGLSIFSLVAGILGAVLILTCLVF